MTSGAPPVDAEGREPGSAADEPSGFVGRGGWHLIAFLAALALILAMSLDWYTTEQGEEFRRVEENAGNARQVEPDLDEQAAQAAEAQEKTAWQADAFLDRVIMLACLAAFLGAVVAAFMRSAGRRPEPPWHPSAIATVAGVVATLLILYRMIQPPGINEAAVIKIGAPLGLVAVGVLTIASRLAVLGERDEALATAGPRAAAAPPVEAEVEAEPEAGAAEKPKRASRWKLRRKRGEKEEQPAEAPAEPAAAEATPFEFEFPAAPPPVAEHREDLATDEPPAEEPAALDEPVYEEPAAEEPAYEEPPPVEEPPAEEPVYEEPRPADEPAYEEPPPVEEPPAEEPAYEEPPPAEEPPGVEPAYEEPPARVTVFPETPPIEEPPAEEESAYEEPPPADEPPPEPVAEPPVADAPFEDELDQAIEEEPSLEPERFSEQPVDEELLDEEEPAEDAAAEGGAVDEEPLPGEDPGIGEASGYVEEEPDQAEPVDDGPVEPDPVEDDPVEDDPVEADPVAEPPVGAPDDASDDPLPVGEEIEFEREPEDPADEPGRG